MFVVPLRHKLSIFFFTSLCLSAVKISFVPFGSAPYFVSYCFFFSEIPLFSERLKELMNSIIYRLLIMMMVATIILAIFSPHYHNAFDFARLLIFELFGKYFIIAYSFICLRKEKDILPSVKILKIGLILLTLFGIHNLITKQSFWFHLFYPEGTKDIGIMGFELEERFRVQSMFLLPFDYGYICALASMICNYLYSKNLIRKIHFIIYTGMCLFGIYFCGCRTVILVWVVASFVYYWPILSVKKKKISFLSFILFIFFILPSILTSDFGSLILSAFSTDIGEGNGSSIGMRIVQLGAVFSYMPGHWLFGNGMDFFSIDLGWGDDGVNTLVDKDLWGVEGVYLKLLLERGIFGLVVWGLFYFTIFFNFIKIRKTFKYESMLGIAVLTCYFLFAMATGELGSVFPTLLTLGCLLKLVKIESQSLYGRIKSNNFTKC